MEQTGYDVVIALLTSSLITGSIYALLALGVVVVYKSTRIFNFAQGHFASLSAYVAYAGTKLLDVPFGVALAIGAGVGVLLGLLMDRGFLRGLYSRPPIEVVIATVGVGMIIEAFVLDRFGADPVAIPEPFGGATVRIFGAAISVYGLMVSGITVVTIIVLSVGLRATRVGLQARVSFEDPVAARLVGVRVVRIRSVAWMVGGGLAGLAGVLLTPILFLTPDSMNLLLVTALLAAVIGGVTSLYGAVIGGILLALVVNLFSAFVSLEFKSVFMYLFLIVFLVVRPFGLFGKAEAPSEGSTEPVRPRQWFASSRDRVRVRIAAWRATSLGTAWKAWSGAQIAALAGAVVAVYLAPLVLGSGQMFVGTSWLVSTISVVGLVVAFYYGGRLHFAQAGFMGIGAYTVAILYPGGDGWVWFVPLAGLAAGLVGFLFAALAHHLQDVYFAIASLGLGLLIPELIIQWNSVTGGGQGKSVAPPTLGGAFLSTATMYFVIATVVVIIIVALLVLRNSRAGRAAVAVRDSARGAMSIGIRVKSRPIALFTISAVLGGIAGGLEGLLGGVVTPSMFDLQSMILLFAAAVVAGSIVGSPLGAAVVVLIPLLFQNVPSISYYVFGAILILSVYLAPKGRDGIDVFRMRALRGRVSGNSALALRTNASRSRGERPIVVSDEIQPH
ncbi:hypothetical protein BH09ACT6_BH09ACT6_15090 [soil metagenome]